MPSLSRIEGRKQFDSSAKADPSQSCGKASNFNMTMVEEGRSIGPQNRAENMQKVCAEHARNMRCACKWLQTHARLPHVSCMFSAHFFGPDLLSLSTEGGGRWEVAVGGGCGR